MTRATASNEPDQEQAPSSATGKLVVDLGRAFGGALIFGLPMLMTMELWHLGFTMDRWRLLVLMLVFLPVLVGVSHRVGFEATFRWRDDLRDAFLALGIGTIAAAATLALFDLIDLGMPPFEIVGKVAIEAVPAALGALLGRSQLGTRRPTEEEGGGALSGYFGALFLMLVGALFFSLNMAPTDEIMVIAHAMDTWHVLALILVSLGVMHCFVFALSFRGNVAPDPSGWFSKFARLTLPGYAIALAMSLYILWTFGRTSDLGAQPVMIATIVLAFPASLGAAAARLIL